MFAVCQVEGQGGWASGVLSKYPIVSSISSVHRRVEDWWGSHLQNLTAAGKLTEEELNFIINFFEMKAIKLALNAFRDCIMGESVV